MACLADYSELIPGTLETVSGLRGKGILIRTTTGHFTDAMELHKAEAGRRGFMPDSSACATQVPAGRPQPWIVLQNMFNTGAWTIGLAKTGNEVGLKLDEINALDPPALARKLASAREALAKSRAHYVVDSIADAGRVTEDINLQLAREERP